MKKQWQTAIFPFFAVIFALYTLTFPLECTYLVRKALSICTMSLIPSLFPFMFLMKFYCRTKTVGKGNIFSLLLSKLLGVSRNISGIVFLGMFAGFPSGATGICEMYKKGLCTKSQAENGIAISDNCSAAFLMGVCGGAVLGSQKYGFMLILAQTLAVITFSRILRVFLPKEEISAQKIVRKAEKDSSVGDSFIYSVKESAITMLYICAFVVVFYLLSGIVSHRLSVILPKWQSMISTVISGFLEMSSGAFSCSRFRFPENIVLCSAVTGFSGLSVYFQISGICSEFNLSTGKYLLSRLFMLFLCPLYTILILLCVPSEILCFSGGLSTQFYPSFRNTYIAIIIICGLAFAVAAFKKFIYVKIDEKKS